MEEGWGREGGRERRIGGPNLSQDINAYVKNII